jgi:GH18 family chitinase
MWRSFSRVAVVVGLLASAVGCGGGGGGPRGAGNGSGGTGGAMNVDPTSRPSLRTVLYVPTWHGGLSGWTRQLAFQNVSYVNLSFVEIDAGGNVRFPDSGLTSFVTTAHAAGAKVCVAIGGATTISDGGVFATLLQDANRPTLVGNLVEFARDNQLDCLDVDLEGNGVNAFYEAFVTELSAPLKADGRELTAAVAGWFADGITDKALLTFDFVNVMAYDLYSSRDTPMQWSSIEAATREVDRWVTRGMPKERVVYGVPFYGMQWPFAGGDPKTIGYGDLLRGDAMAAIQDELQGNGTVTYLNSRATIQAKAQLATSYGGIMAWEAGQDATGDASLLQAIRDAVP